MPDIFDAAEKGDLELVKDHYVVDAGCILKTDRLPPAFSQFVLLYALFSPSPEMLD